ncbi:MAG: cytochrome C oxidase subunit IV family protein [Deltaproteobacteria bacterium]|nr:cytochrome C oxidase subunit IV family protein [Deltaproteobacteria bacterium]
MSSSHAIGHDHEHAGGHITPLPVYFAVYGALLVLTVVTVAVSYMGLPPLQSITVAMLVAMVKATLVGAWFMHLKYDAKFNVFTFLAALWFMASFFVFTFYDLASRGMVNEVTGQHVLHKDMDEQKK